MKIMSSVTENLHINLLFRKERRMQYSFSKKRNIVKTMMKHSYVIQIMLFVLAIVVDYFVSKFEMSLLKDDDIIVYMILTPLGLDLQDLRDGVELVWEDDRIKEEKEQKKEKRKQLRQKAIDRLEKKLIEVGYENLPDTSIDRVHADKWLDPERLEELKNIRKQKTENKRRTGKACTT